MKFNNTGLMPKYHSVNESDDSVNDIAMNLAMQVQSQMNDIRREYNNDNVKVTGQFIVRLLLSFGSLPIGDNIVILQLGLAMASKFSLNVTSIDKLTYVGMYQNQMYHTTAISVNQMDTIYGQMATNDSKLNIKTDNQPLPLTVVCFNILPN